jgi:peptidyl-prolyl cis-trans isomerase D
MLSTMREKTKIVMVILAVAFVGWLVFDVGMGVSGRSGSSVRDIGSVNGHPIPYQTWLQTYQSAYESARQQNPGVTFSREDQRQIEDQAFDQLVEDRLIQDEMSRRGIAVTDREIVDAVRRYPPQEVVQSPEFQTAGRFDPQKYERFLATNNENTRAFVLSLEQRYREQLPRIKLLEQITADIFVSDAKLWQVWRDQHDSVTVRALIIRPATAVADASVRVTDEDARRYYEAHKADFKQPARAFLSFVALSKLPTTVDSVLLLQRARALRDSILHGADFAALARAESADTASGSNGGLLPVFGHGRMLPAFEQAAFRLPIGQVSEPVFTSFGLHLIKVEKRTRDSVTARHILLPYARFGARLDTLEARADSLDRLAGEQQDGRMLDSVARIMRLPLEKGPVLYKGTPYVLGRYTIPDVGVWAFETRPGETGQVIETSGAYYVFRLDSAAVEGVPSLNQVEDQVRVAAVREKKRAAAEAIARDAERRLNQGRSLEQVALDLGLTLQTLGPFTRTANVPILGAASAAMGTAFRLRVGERSGLLQNADAFFFLQPERRVSADSTAWAAQKEQQRAQITQLARQVRLRYYYAGLRRAARVSDRRDAVLHQTAATEPDAQKKSQ